MSELHALVVAEFVDPRPSSRGSTAFARRTVAVTLRRPRCASFSPVEGCARRSTPSLRTPRRSTHVALPNMTWSNCSHAEESG
jgi:hypothetical protein